MTAPCHVGMASLPAMGSSTCGDAAWIWEDVSRIRLVVVDASGHGASAAHACRTISQSDVLDPALSIQDQLLHLHQQLQGTVGAAGMVLEMDRQQTPATVRWVGVGNIRLWSQRAQPTPQQGRPGLLGHRLPSIRHNRLSLQSNEAMFVATDGVLSSAEHATLTPGGHPSCETWAHAIVHDHHRSHDDATLVILCP